MSNSLKEQLKEHYNASQQAAIASVMCPGQALFTLLQVSKSFFTHLHYYYFVIGSKIFSLEVPASHFTTVCPHT